MAKKELFRMWVPKRFKKLVTEENIKNPLKKQSEIVEDIADKYEKWSIKARKKRLF